MLPSKKRLNFAIVLLILAGIIGFFVLKQVPPLGGQEPSAALIGGPFTLVTQAGKTVSEQDFRGRYMLVAFGFTSCPDICPTQLSTMMSALDSLGHVGNGITPVFITIDPERDSPEHLREYLAAISTQLVGLSGTPEQIARVAKAYHVHYEKVTPSHHAEGYMMDHSTSLYLMDRQGRFLKSFSYPFTAEDLARNISVLMQ